MLHHIRFVLLSSLVACSSDGDPHDVTITTQGAPSFLAVRNDTDAAWTVPTAIDATTFRFTATGPYRVTSGCSANDVAIVNQYARTLDDNDVVTLDCGSVVAFDATITSTMVQPGNVAIDNFAVGSSDPNWEVEVPTLSGTHDVVALTEDQIAVFRDISVETTVELPPIDVLAQGVPLVSGTLTASNARPDESLSSLVYLELGDTFVVLDGTPDRARFAPDRILERSDTQYIELGANSSNGTSRFATSATAGSATLTLPDPIEPATFQAGVHDLTATWQSSLTGQVDVQVIGFTRGDGTFWVHQLQASAAYTDARTSMTLDLESIPNLPASMLFDLATTSQSRTVTITDAEHGQGVGYTRSENEPAAGKRQLPRALSRQLTRR